MITITAKQCARLVNKILDKQENDIEIDDDGKVDFAIMQAIQNGERGIVIKLKKKQPIQLQSLGYEVHLHSKDDDEYVVSWLQQLPPDKVKWK